MRPTASSGRVTGAEPRSTGLLGRLAARRLPLADRAALLAACGLSPTLLVEEGGGPVPVAAEMVFVERAASLLDDPLLGLHLAAELDVREVGSLYYAAASAPTLLVALQISQTFSAVLTEGLTFAVSCGAHLEIVSRHNGVSRQRDTHHMEFWTLVILRCMRAVVGRDLLPERLAWVHRPHGDVAESARLIGVRPEYGADRDRLVFDAAMADLPLLNSDPHLARILGDLHERRAAARIPAPTPFQVEVQNALVARLGTESVALDGIARDLGLSERTLARRLAAEGTSFASMLRSLRMQMADDYVRRTALPMSSIATRLGYADLPAFVRAYRRWYGGPPAQARRGMRGGTERA